MKRQEKELSTHDLNGHDFVVRNANKTDLDQLMSLEQNWPPDQRVGNCLKHFMTDAKNSRSNWVSITC
jgi:hypothetical protein